MASTEGYRIYYDWCRAHGYVAPERAFYEEAVRRLDARMSSDAGRREIACARRRQRAEAKSGLMPQRRTPPLQASSDAPLEPVPL
jgi:hypothetical protein